MKDLFKMNDVELLNLFLKKTEIEKITKKPLNNKLRNPYIDVVLINIQENEIILVKEPAPYGNPFKLFKKVYN